MTYNVTIDEDQEAVFIEPIFESLIKNNASDDLLKKVFFDLKIPNYFSYLPNHLQNDPDFLKESFKNQMISLESIPDHLLNTDFISKEMYIKNVSVCFNSLNEELYPQDEDIVFGILKNSSHGYWNIQDKFKNDSNLMIKCLVENSDLFRFLTKETQETFLNDRKLLINCLKKDPSFYNHISGMMALEDDILKAVLYTDKGYQLVQHNIRKSKDPEIALLALSYTDTARKNIHQMYSSILKQNKINTNCHNFLKLYLCHNTLEKTLTEKNNDQSRIKI